MIDNLDYNYSGNKLIGMYDISNNPDGYSETFSTGDNSNPFDPNTWEYYYDANSNMRQDLNTEILTIQYNYLNLPKYLFFDKGTTTANIYYAYDASGSKLKYNFGSSLERYYFGNFVYDESGSLIYILHPEGRINVNSTTYTYEYWLKDHLGNTRVAFSDDNGDGAIASRRSAPGKRLLPLWYAAGKQQ